MNLFVIAIGGAIGSIARYLMMQLVEASTKDHNASSISSSKFLAAFPFNTFCVNALGSLIAGVLYYFVIKNFDQFDPKLKNFLFAGFLGGFTTFSAFSLDFFRLFTAGQYAISFIYATSSVLFSIAAIFTGFYLAKFIA